MNVDGPTFWPPNSGFMNSCAFGKRAVGDVDMNALREWIVTFNKFLVLSRIVAENARGDNCDRHVSPRLICDNGVDIFRRGGEGHS